MTLNQPTSLTCPTCGAPLEADGTSTVIRCKFCGSTSMLPGSHVSQPAGMAPSMDEIRRLASNGDLAAAIARYCQAYGVDEAEARNIIETLQSGRLAMAAAPGMRDPQELTKALEEVQQRLKAGDKIGAIKVYREHYDVGLERAKYAVEQIEAGQTLRPETGFQALNRPMTTAQAPQKTRSGSRAGGIVLAIILLVVAGVVGLIIFLSTGSIRHGIPETPFAQVSTGTGAAPEIAGVFFNADADSRSIGLVDLATGKMVWQAAKLPGDGSAQAISSDESMVYATNGDNLLAYHKSDGSLAWQVQMPDKLNYGANTILVAAGRVITSNANESIQAYDSGTGQQVWSKRLNGYDRTLRLMGKSLVVIDTTDSSNDYGLMFIDPTSGSQQGVITPTCSYNDYTSNLDPDAGLLYDQAGNALYLVYDSSYGCVQKLDLGRGKPAWEADSKDNFNFAPDGLLALMTDSTLYFSNHNNLMAVDKASGTMKVLLTNPDYELLPEAVAGNILIVRARRTRGSETFQLWGVDTTSGNPAWQISLQNASPIDPPNDMAGMIDNTDSAWTWHLASTGLVIGTFQAKPNQIVLETFNPATGASQGKKAGAIKGISGDFYDVPAFIGWQGDIGYFYAEVSIYSVDVTTGQVKIVY